MSKEIYCKLQPKRASVLSDELTMEVDYGKGNENEPLLDDNGKKIVFQTIMEPINYMAEDGWKFVSIQDLTGTKRDFINNVIMRKEVD
ncbi:MAG: hypothetical protein P1U35_12835 [Cycloclasticus sp.]|nr:hypothetical protein [Cycloclasticus sp.]